MLRSALAMLLLACDPVPPEVGFRRIAAARLQSCVANNACQFVSQCHRELEAFCVDAGYPKTCGNGEVEGSCGTGIK